MTVSRSRSDENHFFLGSSSWEWRVLTTAVFYSESTYGKEKKEKKKKKRKKNKKQKRKRRETRKTRRKNNTMITVKSSISTKTQFLCFRLFFESYSLFLLFRKYFHGYSFFSSRFLSSFVSLPDFLISIAGAQNVLESSLLAAGRFISYQFHGSQ